MAANGWSRKIASASPLPTEWLPCAKTLQRLASELDARAHLSQGERRSRFKSDMAEHGLKVALQNRDAPFGDSRIRLHSRST